ncbi:unnamed protein product [Citrullus colocynthis]|uniref:Uncharacterized protein n=1 Tax=Citrullus colocynthis TaxID=252529 RepID=A0ABP0Y415_9ROSI
MGNDDTNPWDEKGVSQHHSCKKRVRNTKVDALTKYDMNLNGGEWDENCCEDVGCDPPINEFMPTIVFNMHPTPHVHPVFNAPLETPILHNEFSHLLGNVPRMLYICWVCGTSGIGPSVMQPHSSSGMNMEVSLLVALGSGSH